jgi:hypothetical protein
MPAILAFGSPGQENHEFKTSLVIGRHCVKTNKQAETPKRSNYIVRLTQ